MKNPKFIRLQNYNDVKDFHIAIDSIECIFSSKFDYLGTMPEIDFDVNVLHNFIKLKTGQFFETKESPDEIRLKIDPDYLFVPKEKARMVDSDGKTHIFS